MRWKLKWKEKKDGGKKMKTKSKEKLATWQVSPSDSVNGWVMRRSSSHFGKGRIINKFTLIFTLSGVNVLVNVCHWFYDLLRNNSIPLRKAPSLGVDDLEGILVQPAYTCIEICRKQIINSARKPCAFANFQGIRQHKRDKKCLIYLHFKMYMKIYKYVCNFFEK